MITNQIVRLFVVGFFVVGNASCQKRNEDYLGSPYGKAYNFPWLVTLHRLPPDQNFEFFGTGSIVGPSFVLCSMDSFTKYSRWPPQRPFLQLIQDVHVYAAGIWGKPYNIFGSDDRPTWMHDLLAEELTMWSTSKLTKVSAVRYSKGKQPALINEFPRSPFGFSYSIAVLNVSRSYYDRLGYQNRVDGFLYTRICLPIPVPTWASYEDFLKQQSKVIAKAELIPDHLQCYLGGYSSGREARLLEHRMVYVPFEECQKAYCDIYRESCMKWPINGTHVCFKSVTFSSPCWWDQGSALYCSHVYHSVFGILTSAPTCGDYGYLGLPAVFTLIPFGLHLYEDVTVGGYVPIKDDKKSSYLPGPKNKLHKIPEYDINQLTSDE